MANRPVFTLLSRAPYHRVEDVTFQYYPGLAKSQQQKCIVSLHAAFRARFPERKVLEISSKSLDELGVRLSAFNLTFPHQGRAISVECAYQAGKIFRVGGPYEDIMNKSSREAKKDPRLQNSGDLVGFRFDGMDFPMYPSASFYDWLYVNALMHNSDLAEQLLAYDGFTDIVFNPSKSMNCQARSCAVYVSLVRAGKLAEALKSPEAFIRTVYC